MGVHNTIKSREELEQLFSNGMYVATPLFAARICETPEGRGPGGRVAFVAGKKLGNAVLRNRSKRVMREMARRNAFPMPGYDVVFIARRGTATASVDELDASCQRLCKRISKERIHGRA